MRGILGVHNRALVRAEGPILLQLAQLVVAWSVPYAPGTTRTLPQSSVPTFLMNGRMDAQTPVTGGATIAAGLTNATNYVYPRSGHAVGLVEGPALDAAVEFLADPSHAPRYTLGKPAPAALLRSQRTRAQDARRGRLARLPHRPANQPLARGTVASSFSAKQIVRKNGNSAIQRQRGAPNSCSTVLTPSGDICRLAMAFTTAVWKRTCAAACTSRSGAEASTHIEYEQFSFS